MTETGRCTGEAELPISFSAEEGLEEGPTFRGSELMCHLSEKPFGEQTSLC